MITYASVLTALGDPTRRRIFEILRQGPRAVGEIAGELPVSRPAVSQHLKVLRRTGLVTEKVVGTRHIYYPAPSGLEPLRHYLDAFWSQALDALQAFAEDPQQEEQQ